MTIEQSNSSQIQPGCWCTYFCQGLCKLAGLGITIFRSIPCLHSLWYGAEMHSQTLLHDCHQFRVDFIFVDPIVLYPTQNHHIVSTLKLQEYARKLALKGMFQGPSKQIYTHQTVLASFPTDSSPCHMTILTLRVHYYFGRITSFHNPKIASPSTLLVQLA